MGIFDISTMGRNVILSLFSIIFICLLMVMNISVAYAQMVPIQQQPVPFLPPSQTTFPPSVFPPTQSFLPSTSFAIPTGSLSPWFPSIPAVACGGTFSFTIIGKISDNKGEDLGNGKQRIAIQINSAGGI